MFKNKKSQLNKQNNTTTSKSNQLFVPLNEQEQQAISGGGCPYRGACGSGGG